MAKKLSFLAVFILFLVTSFLAIQSQFFNFHSKKSQTPYQKLEAYIKVYTKAAQHAWPTFKEPQLIIKGEHNAEIANLKKALILTKDLSADNMNDVFDIELEDALKKFQIRHGIKATGKMDAVTQKALAVSPLQRLKQIKSNLVRWKKWNKQDSDYLWINIPEFRAKLISANHTKFDERVIIGKNNHQTPILESSVSNIIVNPYWTVPPSIAKETILPTTLANPSYFEEKHMHLYSSANQELSATDLQQFDPADYLQKFYIRQDPGPQNPLGSIKFQFDNADSIYLHDTPKKELFKKNQRALSSGCIRLENPWLLYETIKKMDLSLQAEDTETKKSLADGKTINIELKKPIPIKITYFTSWVDEKGLLHFASDIYHQDSMAKG